MQCCAKNFQGLNYQQLLWLVFCYYFYSLGITGGRWNATFRLKRQDFCLLRHCLFKFDDNCLCFIDECTYYPPFGTDVGSRWCLPCTVLSSLHTYMGGGICFYPYCPLNSAWINLRCTLPSFLLWLTLHVPGFIIVHFELYKQEHELMSLKYLLALD